MNISLYEPVELDVNTTGYKLRQRREELRLSGKQLAQLTDISKSQILKAERSQFYLNREHYERICVVLQIDPESIMDNEYKFFYEGYGQALTFLISKIGISAVLDSLQIQRRTLQNWVSELWMPQFNQRRVIVKLYSNYAKQ